MDNLLINLNRWASSHPDIRLVLLSPTELHQHPDFSGYPDLKVQIFSTEPDHLMDRPGWLESFAEVWTWQSFLYGFHAGKLKVLYAGGRQVEILIYGISQHQNRIPQDYSPQISGSPVSPLVSKDELLLQQIQLAENIGVAAKPTETVYLCNVRSFFMRCCLAGKRLCAGNRLEAVRTILEAIDLLEEMRTWHIERIRPAAEADRIAIEQDSFAGNWSILINILNQYRRPARGVALQYGFEYPVVLDARVSSWLTSLRHS